jgi:hypothetical protein
MADQPSRPKWNPNPRDCNANQPIKPATPRPTVKRGPPPSQPKPDSPKGK